MTLIDLIPILETMPHDEIRDWIDYCEFWHLSQWIETDMRGKFLKAVRNRRAGLDGGLPYDAMFPVKSPLTMTTKPQKQSESILKSMDEPTQKTAIEIAKAFHRLKAPIRRTSEGNIQVKFIPYERTLIDPETGLPQKDENGKIIKIKVQAPYLYLRYWQVQGEKSRTKSRMKSVYIGGDASFSERVSKDYEYPYKKLAHYFYDLIQEHGIERTRKGLDKPFKVRPKGDDNPIADFESRIMACIDMDTVDTIGTGAINHECLEKLQADLP